MAKFKEGDVVFYITGAGFRDQLVIASIQAGIVKHFLVGDKYLMHDRHVCSESDIFWTHDEAVSRLLVVMDKKIEHLKEKASEFMNYRLGILQTSDGDGT